MGRSIENKIQFKAAMIYAIVAIGVVAIMLYLNDLRQEISSQRAKVTDQRTLLSNANMLIYKVSEAQSFSSLYLSLKDRKYLREYTRLLDSIGTLIDTIILSRPNEEGKLRQIEVLLREQAQNITNLNRQFSSLNPVMPISKRIEEYEPGAPKDTVHIINIRKDSVISEVPRKGFFKRLKEVFKQDRRPVTVAVNQRTDTIRTVKNDSLEIIQEVSDIALEAQKVYERNIKAIEKRVGRLISTDKNIAAKISALLLEFQSDALESTLATIEESERKLDRNYTWSTVGGVVALALILTFITLIITDINKGAQARHALELANARIHQVMQSRHRLLLSVAHDIKTPLNSILGYLGQMQHGSRVESMQNSSEHILAMLENLLEFSSLEQGMLQKSESDFNLHELSREIYELFLPLAMHKLLALSFEADNVRIRTDRVKIKQIVINLVSNSVKYTRSGAVEFSAHFDVGRLKIAVRDTGVGIPEEKLPHLFKPFSRIEQNNSLAEGTGFGMFLVKGLVDLLGGEIRVDSKVGAGTTVGVSIPVQNAREECRSGAQRIKIFDDDPTIVRLLSDMLVALGHHVVDSDYDLIITDMEMGNVSGMDILRETDGKPVVVMTGRADFSARRAEETGFSGFLAKPFSIESLREVVGVGELPGDLLGDDRKQILALFRTSTNENFGMLRQALTENDFGRAQALCHKMFPMFAQLGYPAGELRKMDIHRNDPYEGWQEDVRKILAIRV